MKELPNNNRLLLAAWRFQTSPREARAELAEAVMLPVEGVLFNQLRDACRRGLDVKPAELHLLLEGIGELIAAIGAHLPPRVPAGAGQLPLPYSV